MTVRYESPAGPLWLTAEEQGLSGLAFSAPEGLREDASSCGGEYIARAVEELEEYFAHRRCSFDIPLVLHGTLFQKQIWQVLQDIGYGETISYAEEARRAGRPRAFRAAANANHANPVAILVPCHRVIAGNGGTGGYGGGLEMKRFLLELESPLRAGRQKITE